MTRCVGMSLLLTILLAAVVGAQDKAEITVKTMPPSVVKTVPQAGDTEVDPSLKKITVTFSKDMMTKEMWSWCSQSPETFPEIDKTKIRYLENKRTCVLPVKLKAGKTYIIWINTRKFNYFKDTENNSAVPYLLVFQTARTATSSPNCDGEAAAVSVAEAWLSLVDKGKYEKSWFEAAQYFKSVVSEDQWEQAIRAVRKPLGKNLSRDFISKSCHTSLPGAPDGEYVVIQFKASFENKKSAIETITPMMDKDGKWRVSGYYIKQSNGPSAAYEVVLNKRAILRFRGEKMEHITTVNELLTYLNAGNTVEYIFFWRHHQKKGEAISQCCLSNRYPAGFTVEGVMYATTEHYMMLHKAKPFTTICLCYTQSKETI